MAFQATQDYSTGVFDLYPLFYGARAWLTTGSAYNLKAVAPAADAGVPLLELGDARVGGTDDQGHGTFPDDLIGIEQAGNGDRRCGIARAEDELQWASWRQCEEPVE